MNTSSESPVLPDFVSEGSRANGTRRPLRSTMSDLALRYPDISALGVVVVVIILGNLPYLSGLADSNPMHWVAGLTDHARQGILPGWDAADPNSGFTAQALGHRAALDLLHGHAPWWNPYEGLGAPLAGSMQAAAFFPLTFFLALPDGQVLFYLGLELIAGVSTYFLLRRLGVLRSVAVAGGAAFALNGTFSWFRHAAANPVAFLPVMLLGVEICADPVNRRWGRGSAVVAAAVALSLYAGFPETAYIDGVFVGVWTAVRLIQLRNGGWRSLLLKAAAGVTIGLLLAAPIVIAFLDYAPHWSVGGHDSFAFGALPRSGLPMLSLPYIYGPIAAFLGWDKSGALTILWGNVGGYTAISLVLLAVFAVVGRTFRLLRLALAAWTVLVVWRTFTFGDSSVAKLFHLVPGLRQTAFYRYSQPSWELAVVVLAALGLNDLLMRPVRRARWGGAIVIALLTTAMAARGSRAMADRLVHAPHYRAWWTLSVAGAIAVILLVGASVAFLRGRTRTVAVCSFVLAEVVVLFILPQLSAPRNTIETGGVRYLQTHLGPNRFFTLGPVAPNYGSYFAIGSVAINNFPPKSYDDYIRSSLNANVNPIDFTGTAMLDPSGPSPDQELERNLPNYEAVGVKYVVVGTAQALRPSLARSLREVYHDNVLRILELPDPKPYFESLSGACRLRYNTRTRVVATCADPTELLRRELYMPGWEARINGRQATISEHQRLFQTVSLPSGTSTVVFEFTPPHLLLALGGFLAGIALLGAFLLRRSQRERKGFSTIAEVTSPSRGQRALHT